MEEKTSEIFTCRNDNEQNLLKSPSLKSENKDIESEKNELGAELNVNVETKGIKSEKNELGAELNVNVETKDIKSEKNELEAKGTELNANVETESKINDEIIKSNGNKVLKRKVTEDGVFIERVLSEGEASSGFETVSSIDSIVDIDDLEFSASLDDDNNVDDYNIIVKVKNELAFQNKNRPDERFSYNETKSKNSDWQNHKTDCISNEYTNRRHNGAASSRESKYWHRNNVDKNYNYDRRSRESSERKNFDNSRQRTCNKDQSTYREQVRRSKRNRWDNSEGRSRRSRSKNRTGRYRGSRSPGRIVRNRSPNYKDIKKESRHSRSFERNSIKPSPERSSPPRKKRRNSPSKVSSSSVWKRVNSRKSPSRIKKEEINNDKKSQRNCFDTPPRRKERTPFLVELERKLKEVEYSKNIKQVSNGSTDSTMGSGNESIVMPAPPPIIDQSCNLSLPLTYMTTMPCFQGAVYPVSYPSTPAVSVNNLPLVPGPTGLPVHISIKGEPIPHDKDERPTPVGPNGYYLPVDPTGRIFAHIISPENQAVPIYITENGVLRLPNSEPVPFGPEHQLPVNIDGRVIPIGPDSKPLYPCPDIPNNPSINLLQMMNYNGSGQVANTVPEPPQPSKPPSPPPPPPQTEVQEIVQTKAIETQTENQFNIEPSVVDLSLLNLIQNPSEEFNKAELLNKYRKKAQEKSEEVLKCVEIEKNLGISTSKGGVRRSIPMKLSQKKNSRDDTSSSGSDMALDSGDSDTTSAIKLITEPNKGPIEEIIMNSDDENDILEIICDKDVPKESNLGTKFEDYITEKIQRALKLLNQKNHVPPAVGRFIISDVNLIPSRYNSPNESPLLRNRIQLSFLTPKIYLNDQPITVKESEIRFKFLPQKRYFPKVEKQSTSVKQINSSSTTSIPIFTFDFAMQCDFTSEIIRNLNFKVSRLETEITRLKRINANLFDNFRILQNAKERKSEELKKALVEIQDKNNEILSLKRSIEYLE